MALKKMQFSVLLVAFILCVSLSQWATAVPLDSHALLALAHNCEENMEYTTCGTSCPDKCSDKPEELRICTQNCVIGCRCKSDYKLNDAGKCVLTKDC